MQRYGVHERLAESFGQAGDAAWTLVATAVLVSVAAWLAYVLRSALVFASLGPIIFQTIDEPLAPASSPRSAILANAIALVAGYGALVAFGLGATPPVTVVGVSAARACAVTVALAFTAAVVVTVRALHPPAGATALLVSLGFVRDPIALLLMFAGVVIVVVAGVALNRLARVPVPLWSPRAGGA